VGLLSLQRAGTSYIDAGSTWQNPWVESYGSRVRDELLSSSTRFSRPRSSSLTGRAKYND